MTILNKGGGDINTLNKLNKAGSKLIQATIDTINFRENIQNYLSKLKELQTKLKDEIYTKGNEITTGFNKKFNENVDRFENIREILPRFIKKIQDGVANINNIFLFAINIDNTKEVLNASRATAELLKKLEPELGVFANKMTKQINDVVDQSAHTATTVAKNVVFGPFAGLIRSLESLGELFEKSLKAGIKLSTATSEFSNNVEKKLHLNGELKGGSKLAIPQRETSSITARIRSSIDNFTNNVQGVVAATMGKQKSKRKSMKRQTKTKRRTKTI